MDEYIESFHLQLEDNNFEPNVDKTVWRGQIHVAWANVQTGEWNSVQHQIKIWLPVGFPFNAPVVISADDPPLEPSWHLEPGELPSLCLWDRQRAWKPSFSAQKLLHRIEDWFYYYHTESWPPDSQVPDLHLYLSKVTTAVIGDLWKLPTDREWGRFKLWFSPKYFIVSPAIVVAEDTSTEPEERLSLMLTGDDIKGETGVWFRVPEPFVPSSELMVLFASIDRLMSKENGWALATAARVTGGRRKREGDGFPISIAYPDHTDNERYLFLWAQFPKERSKKFNWASPVNLSQTTVRSFQTAPAAEADLLRRSAYISNSLNNRAVTILGIGALGGSVALLLAKAGIGEICLVDSDNLMPGNVMRHICGLRWVGFPKTMAVQSVIKSHNPDCKVERYESSWDPNKLIKYIMGANLVIDTTGNQNFSHHLNQFCIQQNQPMLIAAAYRRARVGRVLVWRNRDDPCIGCYTLNQHLWSEDTYPLIPASQGDEEFIEDGCGAVTEEAVALDMEAIANFVTRSAIAIFRDALGEYNIGMVVNEPILEATLPILHSVGTHWWTNRPIADCPLCGDRDNDTQVQAV